MDSESLKAQLAPGWSPVNIVLMLVAFWFFWPLGLAMLAYILKGADVGVDLREPGSFMPFFRNVGDYLRSVVEKFKSSGTGTGGSVAGGTPQYSSSESERQLNLEREKLASERAVLERERAAFEAEKRAFEKNHSDA